MNLSSSQLRLTGHGLVLREWTDEDLPTMVLLFNDPDVAYRTPMVSPFDQTAARDYVQKARQDRARDQRIHLAITTDGGQAKGEVLLNRSRCSISYIVGAAHRGQRLAVRALKVMTDYVHQVAAIPHALLEIEPDNHPSAAVARAAGFYLTNALPQTVEDKDRCYTLLTWAHRADGRCQQL
jgi:RimJ/RimL family protein N-acetyltransferase